MIRAVIAAASLAIGFYVFTLAGDPQAEEQPPSASANVPENPAIQFGGFVALASELQERRDARRIPVSTFVAMAKEPDTIILDTRSLAAFDKVHVAGTIHLNFSDFTDDKLRETISSKQTRILIYCNNNFIDATDSPSGEKKDAERRKKHQQPPVVQGLGDKTPILALNIPTFINLHGYGYKNVYELADRLHVSDTRIRLEGKSINSSQE